ncbi:toxin-antitoxin system, toxin component, PIN family protein [Alkalispirochaeta sphaeroplastigenens]|uniref:Toxin-antitoxin system, toxin component, PIN family protein n=1 Tax=Alkalispirochaeta sphaeroplastigenens TaxID=1187066 RepID=A0A2S4JFR6_9SPIO|nr:PIN domain-containing protein [Alkalispirochaeta sphaeroplastigenens]POQ98381.1 toxin-antitoxin system, toxin component, PIN family protein [Alkalispirochaeta sphaeroplastigenens]
MSRFTVVYDACVLYPAPLRDLLLQLATEDLFRACWSNQIHDEWIRNVMANRPDLTRQQLERTRDLMNESVLDSVVTDYEQFIPAIHLPDENDRHVVAVAVRCGASVVVTYNSKDFPPGELMKYDLEAVHPDAFLIQQFHLSEAKLVGSARKVRNRLKNPPLSAEDYLSTLEKQGLPQTVALLRSFLSLL